MNFFDNITKPSSTAAIPTAKDGVAIFDNTALPDIIELKNVTQVYKDSKTGKDNTIIKDLNFLIEDKPNQGQFVVILGQSGCVDADTEFFNGEEWKKISTWKPIDKVLQYEEKGTTSLIQPDRYIKLPADTLNLIQSKYGVDQCICNEHTVVYIDRRPNRPKVLHKITGEELFKRQTTNATGFQGVFLTTFEYEGKGINLSNYEIRVMVAVIADGYFGYNTTHCRINLKKERKKDQLRILLEEANIHYTEKPAKNGFTVFYFYAPRREKEFTPFWYGCNQEQLRIIVEESLLWDGSAVNNRKYVSTSIKKSADFLQFAASATGVRATISMSDRRTETRKIYQKIYRI